MEASVQASCNWSRSSGCDFTKAIQTRITHEDIFIKPELDEILCEERAFLVKCPSSSSAEEIAAATACEFQLRVFPRHKIEALTIVCSASKVELFLGPQREYAETVYGTVLGDDDGSELLSFRYDIEVQKSGIVDLTLKLLPLASEICIFGIMLQLAPNPNGVTTLLPTTINLENVQQMLAGSALKLSPNAEKCKMFMKMASKAVTKGQSPLMPQMLMEHMQRQQHQQLMLPAHGATSEVTGDACCPTASLDSMLQSHIDRRLVELEARVNVRLDAIAAAQTAKLDRILEILAQKQHS